MVTGETTWGGTESSDLSPQPSICTTYFARLPTPQPTLLLCLPTVDDNVIVMSTMVISMIMIIVMIMIIIIITITTTVIIITNRELC